MRSRVFIKILSELSKENGFSIKRVLDNVFELKKGNKRIYLRGNDFGLNSSLSNKLSLNKGQTYMVLKENKVPAVPHYGLYNPAKYYLFGDQKKRNQKRLAAIIQREGLPLVLKPAEGSSGSGVARIGRKRELKNAIAELFIRNDEVVLAPYREVLNEYRVVVLGNKVEVAFKKVKTNAREFRYNLCLGAKAEILSPEDGTYKKLEKLAKRATKILGLEFASVDIIETKEHGLEILELNSMVSLNYFSSESKEKYSLAKNIYKKAFKKVTKSR